MPLVLGTVLRGMALCMVVVLYPQVWSSKKLVLIRKIIPIYLIVYGELLAPIFLNVLFMT